MMNDLLDLIALFTLATVELAGAALFAAAVAVWALYFGGAL